MNSTVALCDGCDGLFGADPFTVFVSRRGKSTVTEYCSARCGLNAVQAIAIGADFTSLTIEVIGAYDLAFLQKTLKGTK